MKRFQLQDDTLLEYIRALLESRQPGYQIPESHRHLLDQRVGEEDTQPQSGQDWRTVMNWVREKL
jgi:hypothetical protein